MHPQCIPFAHVFPGAMCTDVLRSEWDIEQGMRTGTVECHDPVHTL